MRRVVKLSPRLARVTLAGDELEGFVVDAPAASVRLLLPAAGERELVLPTWHGNEFLRADGSRPTIRTLTPWRVDAARHELDVGIVLHGTGAASTWAGQATEGDPAAVSGPGRGYTVAADAVGYVLAGDETAIPAIDELLGALPASTPTAVHLEVADPAGRLALSAHPSASITWHDAIDGEAPGAALVSAVRAASIGTDTRVWAAGEAAAMQRIRRHLFEDRGLPRSQATVRGYWKHGRAADAGDEA